MPYDPERHGPHRVVGPGFNLKVYALIRQVPEGTVTTYGDVAARLGFRPAARHVGHALAALTDSEPETPWHRVVNREGRLSLRADGKPSPEQKRRLAREGIRVDGKGRVVDFRKRRFYFDAEDAEELEEELRTT